MSSRGWGAVTPETCGPAPEQIEWRFWVEIEREKAPSLPASVGHSLQLIFPPAMARSRSPLIVPQLQLPCQRLVVESVPRQEFPHTAPGTSRVDAKSAERVPMPAEVIKKNTDFKVS